MCMGAIPPPLPLTVRDWCSGAMARQESPCHGQHRNSNLTELTPEIVHEFIDKIIVHAPDKSSGKRLQEIEIIYNHIGVFDHSKVILWKGKAV